MIDHLCAVAGLIGALVAFTRCPGAIAAGMLLAGFAAGITVAVVLGG